MICALEINGKTSLSKIDGTRVFYALIICNDLDWKLHYFETIVK